MWPVLGSSHPLLSDGRKLLGTCAGGRTTLVEKLRPRLLRLKFFHALRGPGAAPEPLGVDTYRQALGPFATMIGWRSRGKIDV